MDWFVWGRSLTACMPSAKVCLNTYLFESMICDKAGPKDIRFTGMKSDSDNELATYLLRVKEEDAANEFVQKVKEYAGKK